VLGFVAGVVLSSPVVAVVDASPPSRARRLGENCAVNAENAAAMDDMMMQ
jgi:hypothetical protein